MTGVAAEQAQAPLVLSLEADASWVRALLRDSQGCPVVGMESQPVCLADMNREDSTENDPDRLLEKAGLCIDEVMQKAGSLADMVHGASNCCIAGQVIMIETRGKSVTLLVL